MKICVLNGSPKGQYSITLQTVLFLQKKYPDCEFRFIDAGQRIRQYEKDMSEALQIMKDSQLILFAYPVYTFIVPSQLHRFIELMKEAGVDLSGKSAAQITTSKHFYDVTAHEFIKENCQDMGMNYIGGLSADMEDLLTEQGRADAEAFWDFILYHAEGKKNSARRDYDTVILTNCKSDDDVLMDKIAIFKELYPYSTRLINIAEYPFDGGCISCFHCAGEGKCIYKDGFDTFLREQIQTADAIVFAFTIRDHSMGADFKRYDDRQFCNGHRTVTMGMPMGYLINGDMTGEANLRMIIQGRSEVGHNYLAGMATNGDEIKHMSDNLAYALEHKLVLPQNFLGVGGMKIFRDLIYLMRGLMKADHQFYKKHGIYDFPQKRPGTIVKMKLVGCLMNNAGIRKKMGNKVNEGMIAPYTKVIEKN